MATPEAKLAQVQQQMAVMQDRMNNLENQLGAATRTNRTLDQQLKGVTDRLTIAESNTASGSGDKDIRGGLFDKKLYEPQMLEDARDFKEWSEDFIDWVEMCDKEIPVLLTAVAREKSQITELWPFPSDA